MCEFPPSTPSPEILTTDLVQHLSKEIETTTNNMMAFRTRIGFSLCIGPFLLLGSLIVGAKGQPITRLSWFYVVPPLVVIAVCYLGIAYITSAIELQALEQCNKWRRLIREICKTQSMEKEGAELVPNLVWKGRVGVKTAYLVGYSLLFLAVIAAAVIVGAGTPEPKNYSDNGVNVRIEEAAPAPKTEQVTPTPQVSSSSKPTR